MSLRDYFAGQALLGILNPQIIAELPAGSRDEINIAHCCYDMADAMLKARGKI